MQRSEVEAPMPKSIVVGVDPKRDDAAPLELASMLARVTGAPVVAVAAYPRHEIPSRISHAGYDRMMREQAEQALDKAVARLPEHARRVAVPSSHPGQALDEVAAEGDAGLVVLGSTPRGKTGLVTAGSAAAHALHGGGRPVALAPQGYTAPAQVKRIGAAFIDTDEGRAALAAAGALAARTGAELHALTAIQPIDWNGIVAPPTEVLERDVERARVEAQEDAHRAARELLPGLDVIVDVVAAPVVGALASASEQWDVLVCGSRGYGPVRSVLLGSVSRGLTHAARCPLLVLTRGAEPPIESLFAGEAAATTA
jgi:nucleotide-binding universal stress UspA family protein